jgi:hypothetical protein
MSTNQESKTTPTQTPSSLQKLVSDAWELNDDPPKLVAGGKNTTLKNTYCIGSELDINPEKDHPQACSIMNDLKTNNIKGFINIQRIIKKQISSSSDNTLSFSVNTHEAGITKIRCIQPMGGVKVVLLVDVSDGSWFKCFTGDEWRINTKRIFGLESTKYIDTKKVIIDCKKAESGVWVINNVTNEPSTDISFGHNKRAISFAHLTAAFSNPTLMKETLNKNGTVKCNFTTGPTDAEQSNEINVGKYACSFVKNAIFPIESMTLTNIKQPDGEEKEDDTKLNLLYSKLTENVPEISDHIRIWDDKHIMVIIGEDDKEEEWSTNDQIWDKIFRTFGEICKTTINHN